jgi:hypothetical protein
MPVHHVCTVAVKSDYLPVFEDIIQQALSIYAQEHPFNLQIVKDASDADLSLSHTQDGVSVSIAKRTDREENFYPAPVRLGQIVQRVLNYAQRRFLSEGLESLAIGSYVFDPDVGVLTAEKGKVIRLTEKECDILVYLLNKGGQSVARDLLLKEIWQYAENVDTHTLETHIYRLRQKIEDNPAAPTILVTDDKGYALHV